MTRFSFSVTKVTAKIKKIMQVPAFCIFAE